MIFNEKTGKMDMVVSDSFFHEYLGMLIANPKKFKSPRLEKVEKNGRVVWDVKDYNKRLEKHVNENPEASFVQGSLTLDSTLFQRCNDFCADVYRLFGMLEPDETFSDEPDVYHVILLEREIVGTLGYKFGDLPITHTYRGLNISPGTHELMRLAFRTDLGVRIETLDEMFLQKRQDDSPDNWDYKKGNFFYRETNMVKEVGRRLLVGMLSFYRQMAKVCGFEKLPQVTMSTHKIIEDFYEKIYGQNFFTLLDYDDINWEGIPEKSHMAYKNLDFRPYAIDLEILLPDLFAESRKQEDLCLVEDVPVVENFTPGFGYAPYNVPSEFAEHAKASA